MAGPGYFKDNKRGEVNDLRALLRNPEVQRDPKRQRTALQKVIAQMTLGIDVSPLTPEMIMATATKDVVQKKLVYLFLCNYAESNSETTLLVINTLQKDCRDENPMVRGLALRNMCSLRTESLLEYVLAPLKAGLRDRSAYVRKTAVLGALKVFYVSQQRVRDEGIVDSLRDMIHDKDQQVVTNTIVALSEILAGEGGLVIDQPLAHELLNRIRDFNEWGQATILTALHRYTPASEDEVFDILNILEERVKHANGGVVMAAARLFLQFTEKMTEVRSDVYARLKGPLLTLMASGTPELVHTVLCHFQMLLEQEPHLLDGEIAQLFCRYNDPTYVKTLRLDLLTMVCSEANFTGILEELSAYVTDVDADMSRASVQSIGRIAIKLPTCARAAIAQLTSFLDLDIEYISGETMTVMKDLLRKYGEHADEVLPRLQAHLQHVQGNGQAKAAMVWMLGEYGENIPESPYLLEAIIEDIAEEDSPDVRLQLLTATMKLFFKRGPECQAMLGQLLEHEVTDETHMDVHDRAMLYYRLLKDGGVDLSSRVIGGQRTFETFIEEATKVFPPDVLKEFNTLSIVYRQLSNNFITQVPPYITTSSWDGPAVDMLGAAPATVIPVAAAPAAAAPTQSLIGDLMDSDFDGGVSGATPTSSVPDTGMSLLSLDSLDSNMAPGIQLNPAVVLDAPSFEQKWTAADMFSHSTTLQLSAVPSLGEFEATMDKAALKTMASSEQPDFLKFYFYAQERYSLAFFLLEATLMRSSQQLSLQLKTDDPTMTDGLIECIRRPLIGKWLVQ